MVYFILLSYILLAGLFFSRWLDFFLDDQEMTRQMRWFSSFILLIATIFWPIIVPFAYLELLNFHKKNKQIISFLMSQQNSKVVDDEYLNKKSVDSLFPLSKTSSFQNEDNM